jgi:DNA-binding response OmpR family regulator
MICCIKEVASMAKIMIVEDNRGTNKAICEYMKAAGHTLISAYDGAEALRFFVRTN